MTISGANFYGTIPNPITVKFGVTAATVVGSPSATSITALPPTCAMATSNNCSSTAATVVTVTETNADGQQATSNWTYDAPPSSTLAVTSVSPSSGGIGGGTSVKVFGTKFTVTTMITFCHVAMCSALSTAVFMSNNEIDGMTPAAPGNSLGADDVKATDMSANATCTGCFTYVNPPSVDHVTPSFGSTAGGTTVTISCNSCTYYASGLQIKFGSISAQSATFVDNTHVQAVSPAQFAQTVDVKVTDAGGTSAVNSGDQFSYIAPQPDVSVVSPATGPASGGTSVTITGTALTGADQPSVGSVKFGGTPATSYTVDSDNQITAIAPAGAGTVNVVVTTAGGSNNTTVDNQGCPNGVPCDEYTYEGTVALGSGPAGAPNLSAVLLSGGSSGVLELHSLSGSSNYTTWVQHAATAFGIVDPSSSTDWDFFVASIGGDGQPDLFGIHERNTSSGMVEVHVLSAASGYQTFMLHAATPLAAVPSGQFQFTLGSIASDHRSNLYAIELNNTSSGNVEVHVLGEVSNYGTWILHAATPLNPVADSSTWRFKIGDKAGSGDLIAIPHAATSSGMTEVHILTRASGYQLFSLHTATPLGYTSDSQFVFAVADFDGDGTPDLYAVAMNHTGSGHTEVHILGGASNYTSWIDHVATPLGPTYPDTWRYSVH